MQVTRDTWDKLQGELADAQLDTRNWKAEAGRFRDKWLKEQGRADELLGSRDTLASESADNRAMFRTMLRVNWILWGINMLLILLLI